MNEEQKRLVNEIMTKESRQRKVDEIVRKTKEEMKAKEKSEVGETR